MDLISRDTDNIYILLAQVSIWQNDKDKILSDLSTRLLRRRGIGWTEITEGTPFQMTGKTEKVRDYLKKQKIDPYYYFIEDGPGVAPYKHYS